MITCSLRYEIDPDRLSEFEHYALLWVSLVEKFSGQHYGYCLPHEGANGIALALFSFPSLAGYEYYRQKIQHDATCHAAFAYARETACIRRYKRSFFRPVGISGPK